MREQSDIATIVFFVAIFGLLVWLGVEDWLDWRRRYK
jgi:hypothetical protein